MNKINAYNNFIKHSFDCCPLEFKVSSNTKKGQLNLVINLMEILTRLITSFVYQILFSNIF